MPRFTESPATPKAHQDTSYWCRIHIPSNECFDPITDDVAAAMLAERYPGKDIFAVRLAVTEALTNAARHGNGNDPKKRVWVAYKVTNERVLITVEDEGNGFNQNNVRDPLDEDNWNQPGGRGVFLMRAYLTSVDYNDKGTRVTLSKFRSFPDAADKDTKLGP